MRQNTKGRSRPIALFTLITLLASSLSVETANAKDNDVDGIDDELEQTILNAYRPWLYYDNDEPVWPCSATWFVQHSRLIGNPAGDIDPAVLANDPRRVLENGTWSSGQAKSSLKLDLLDDFRTGQFASNRELSVNVAIYGHVVQLSDGPSSSLSYPGFSTTFGSQYIAIQYWLLYPYNDTHAFDAAENILTGLEDIGDHEGDWVWIDILLSREDGLPKYVVYHHHGDGNIPPSVVAWNDVEKRDGAPIIYLEKGTHELWEQAGDGHGLTGALLSIITGLGSFLDLVEQDPSIAVEPHKGNGLQYRPATVLNLGEAGKRILQSNAEEQRDSDLALLFNGEWGDFTGLGQTNPSGPVNQNWPMSSGARGWPDKIYVDFAYSGPQLGTSVQPFIHLTDAVQAVTSGGVIIIRNGNSSERLTISKPCTITAEGGVAIIGQ